MNFDNDRILQHLVGMLQCETVSHPDPEKVDYEEFFKLHQYLEETYPLVHKHLERRVVGRASLLYHWEGSGESGELPVALFARQDVVPPGDAARWRYPPFSGTVADGFVWARGTFDTKCLIAAQMEAVEALLAEGFSPPGDIYLCYGHNEEVQGAGGSGAQEMVRALQGQNVRLGLVLDEGWSVMPGEIFDIDTQLALISGAEKGYADFQLTARATGGHSSQPGTATALSRVCRAVVALEDRPLVPVLLDLVKDAYELLGPHMTGPLRKAASAASTDPEGFLRAMEQSPMTNAMVRSTVAATMAFGSPQANVLPVVAGATVNCRMLPGGSVEDMRRYIVQTVGPEVEVALLKGSDPTPISPGASRPYQIIKQCILRSYPGTVVAPFMELGGTDAKYYYPICENVYRYSPFYCDRESIYSCHAENEHMPVDGFAKAAQFYVDLIKRYFGREDD